MDRKTRSIWPSLTLWSSTIVPG